MTGDRANAVWNSELSDRVAELVLKKKGEKGYTVVAGSLVHCARRGQQAFVDYLDGLLAVLKDGELCETALHSLGQSRACVAVWTALASYTALAPFVVQVIEVLVQGSLGSGSRQLPRRLLFVLRGDGLVHSVPRGGMGLHSDFMR